MTSQLSSAWLYFHSCVLNWLWKQIENRKAPKAVFSCKALLTVLTSSSCGWPSPYFQWSFNIHGSRDDSCRQKYQEQTSPPLCEQPSSWYLGHVAELPSVLLDCSYLPTSGHSPIFTEILTPVSSSLYVLLPPSVTLLPRGLTHPPPAQFHPKPHHSALPHVKNI